VNCSLCGRPMETLEEERNAWKQMVGWVSPKGSKAMTGAKPTGARAHATCIVRLRHGLSIEQSSLF
jgi:hypothetical protein